MINIINDIEAKNIDEITINKGIASKELMKRAGVGIYKEIKKYLAKDSKVLIITGRGGNAGDGYVLANELLKNNYEVNIYQIEKNKEIKNLEAKFYQEEYIANKGKFIDNLVDQYDIYVDAVFGSGLNKEISGEYKEVIDILNSFNGLKISIDIPSGVNGSTGEIMGIAFKCDYLYTIEFYKIGFIINRGRNYFNKVRIVHIGLDGSDINNNCFCLNKLDFARFFPKRERISNKGTYGRVALIGGCKEYLGSILLSYNAISALRCGVGYTTLCIPQSLVPLYSLHYPEIMYKGMSDNDGHIKFNKDDLDSLLKMNAIAIGMGIGISEEVYKVIVYLLNNYEGKLIIDADGINSLSKYGIDALVTHKCDVILTPHIKEFSRLINKEIKCLNLETLSYLKEFTNKYKVIINLKSETSVASDGKTFYFNITGNPSLAKGGSGDVLSGITLGMVVKNIDLLKEVSLASYILGKASDFAIETINENSVIASDIINKISDVLNYISQVK